MRDRIISNEIQAARKEPIKKIRRQKYEGREKTVHYKPNYDIYI